jgi:hypothetical protein
MAKKVIQSDEDDSVLSKTELGWVAHGAVSKTTCKALVNICCEETEDYSHQLVNLENSLILITYVSSDPNENHSLTPNHLLLSSRRQDMCRKQWRIAQCYTNAFWSRWLKEYIPTLQMRSKWTK